MSRNITVTFDDGSTHVYQNAPDTITPDIVQKRAEAQFGKSVTNIDGGKSSIKQEAPPAPEATADNRSLLNKHLLDPLRNAGETVMEIPLALGTGLGSMLAGNVAGVGKEILTGDFGKGTAARFANKFQEKYTYQPRSEGAKFLLGAAGDAFAASKIPVSPYIPMSTAAPTMAAAAIKQQVPLMASLAGRAATPYLAHQAAKAAKLANQSRVDAPRINAAKAAERMNIAISPLESNPTRMNRIKTGLIGQDEIGYAASRANEATIPKAVRADLEIPKNKPLNTESIKAVRAEKGAPYAEVAKIGRMAADEQLMRDINSAYSFKGNTPNVAALLKKDVPTLIDDVNSALVGGFNGKDALDLSRKYRKESSTIYKKMEPSVEELALADAKKSISQAIEARVERGLIELDRAQPNQGYGDLATRFKGARTYIAKSHVYENSMHGTTGVTDMSKLAKIASKENALTGTLADLSEIASFFPQSVKVHPTISRTNAPHLTRAGLGGTVGFGLGMITGIPNAGYAGAVLGAGAETGGRIMGANKLIGKSSQVANLPKDYRPFREQLGYGQNAIPPKSTLSLAPLGEPLLPSRQLPILQGRGMLSLADDLPTGKQEFQMPSVDMPIQPRLKPMYQRGGIPQENGLSLIPKRELPKMPEVPYPGQLDSRGILSLADDATTPRKTQQIESVNFRTRLDVMNTPVMKKAVASFIDEAESIKSAISSETNGFKKSALEARLRGVENRFMAGLKQMGMKNESEARDLMRKVYETGGETQLGIKKVFNPKIKGSN